MEAMIMIQTTCEKIGESGCCLLSFLYAIGVDPILAIIDYDDLVKNGLIATDCTIQDYAKLAKYFKVECSIMYSSNTLAYIKDKMYLGRWTRNGYNHFVVMKNGKVIWNPLDVSKCVNEGTLSDIRVIKEI